MCYGYLLGYCALKTKLASTSSKPENAGCLKTRQNFGFLSCSSGDSPSASCLDEVYYSVKECLKVAFLLNFEMGSSCFLECLKYGSESLCFLMIPDLCLQTAYRLVVSLPNSFGQPFVRLASVVDLFV